MQFRSVLNGSQRYVRIFDWLLGIAALGYGVYAQSWWWIAGGVIGLVLAWYDPGTRIRRYFALVKPAAMSNPGKSRR